MNYQLGRVIAERDLVRRTTDGREVTVQVRVGEPMKIYDVDENVQDWFCPLQILGMGDGKVRAAFGVDSLQALLHALIMAGSLLQSWSQESGENLTWLEESELGFPPSGILQGLSPPLGVSKPLCRVLRRLIAVFAAWVCSPTKRCSRLPAPSAPASLPLSAAAER